MEQRERAQRMNRDGKGQFAATVLPIGESDNLAARQAAQIAMRDLAQTILLAVFKSEKLMSKPPEARAKVMHSRRARLSHGHVATSCGCGLLQDRLCIEVFDGITKLLRFSAPLRTVKDDLPCVKDAGTIVVQAGLGELEPA